MIKHVTFLTNMEPIPLDLYEFVLELLILYTAFRFAAKFRGTFLGRKARYECNIKNNIHKIFYDILSNVLLIPVGV